MAKNKKLGREEFRELENAILTNAFYTIRGLVAIYKRRNLAPMMLQRMQALESICQQLESATMRQSTLA